MRRVAHDGRPISYSISTVGLSALAPGDVPIARLLQILDAALNDTYLGPAAVRAAAEADFAANWTAEQASLDNPSHYLVSASIDLKGPWNWTFLAPRGPFHPARQGLVVADAGAWTLSADLPMWSIDDYRFRVDSLGAVTAWTDACEGPAAHAELVQRLAPFVPQFANFTFSAAHGD